MNCRPKNEEQKNLRCRKIVGPTGSDRRNSSARTEDGRLGGKKNEYGKTQTPPTKKIGRKGEQRCSDLDTTRRNNENCTVETRFKERLFIQLQMRLQL
jgi:hypothetical protein